MKINNFKDLIVWQKSMDLAKEVYNITKKLPKEEMYALSNQMRSAVVSIPSNIAKGQSRSSLKEYIHFLQIAKGSDAELETQLLLCNKLVYLSEDEIKIALELTTEVREMLITLIRDLENGANHA